MEKLTQNLKIRGQRKGFVIKVLSPKAHGPIFGSAAYMKCQVWNICNPREVETGGCLKLDGYPGWLNW